MGKFSPRKSLKSSQACCKMNCFAITDEVYEYITYDAQKHICLASLPGMRERTVVTSSLSKTFSVTGWRISWACATANIASAIRNILIRITDSAPSPFQEAALTALTSPPSYFPSLRREYEARRDHIVAILSKLGFVIHCKPQGSRFLFAEIPKNWLHSDVDFVRALIRKAGVAAMPSCLFFHLDSNGEIYQNRYIRFAFCKSEATLATAARKMQDIVNSDVSLQLD